MKNAFRKRFKPLEAAAMKSNPLLESKGMPWGHAGALAAGGVASFGFAPYAFRPALWIGLVLLFWTISSGPARTAAMRGGLFGIGYFGCGVYWVYYSLYAYASTPLWLAVAIAAALVAYLSLYPMLAAWLGARLLPEGMKRLTGTAALLAGAEWVRGTALSGFPWVLVGQGSLDSPWAGYLPVLGVHGAGLMLLLPAAWVAGCFRLPLPARMAWLGAVAAVAIAGEALRAVSWSEPLGGPVEVAMIQANFDQDELWDESNFELVKRTYFDMTQQVADTPLIIWPESALPKFYRDVIPFYRDVGEMLPADSTLLSGIFYLVGDQTRSRTGIMNLKTGQRYGKRHLVLFGEYTPFADWLGPLYRQMDIRMNALEPSQDRPLVQIRGNPVGMTICYESIYPEVTRLAFPDAAYLINISNDAWFGDTRGPWQHLEANRLRAAETARELLRAGTVGVTAVIDSSGLVQASIPQFQATILEGKVQPRTGATPYMRFGEWPFAMLALFILAFCFSGRKRSLRTGANQ